MPVELTPGRVRRVHAQDPEELAANVSGFRLELSVRSPPERTWKVLELDLAHTRLVWGQLGASVAITGAAAPDALSFGLLSREDTWTVNGIAARHGAITRMAPSADYAMFTSGPVRWVSVRVEPKYFLHRYGLPEQAAGAPVQVLATTTSDVRQLRRTLSGASDIVASRAHDLREAGVRAHLEDTLLRTLVTSLIAARPAARGRRAATVSKLRRLFHCHPESPLRTSDLCSHLGVTPRSLSRIFADLYGMSPARYLRLRRLHQARRFLRFHNGPRHSVTEVGTALGFSDLGRFASDYRAVFGEFPSETLRRR